MRVDELLRYGYKRLKSADIETYGLDTQLLLAYVLKTDRAYLFTHPEREVRGEEKERFLYYIEKRYKQCPVAYITNSVEFFSKEFYVDENVLIPRADTEILVEAVISEVLEKRCRLLEIGAGSGAVSICIGSRCINASITATDISKKALEVAERNRAAHGSDVVLKQGNLFEALDNDCRELDYIVSNPPYISGEEMETLPASVKEYEPNTALYSGEDGLYFYRRIIDEGKEYLKNGGIIFFEIGWNQGRAVKEIFEKQGFSEIEIIKDIAGLNRVVKGKKTKCEEIKDVR